MTALSYWKRCHPLWRLRQKTWFRALQRRFDFPVPIRAGRIRYWVMLLRDFSYVVPHRAGEGLSYEVLAKVVDRFDVGHFFDVGANVGTFAWRALNQKPTVKVHLFEPDRTNLRLLRKTIRTNRLPNISVWEGVVADSTEPREFLVDDVSGATGGIVDHRSNTTSLQAAYGLTRKVVVAATTLDACVPAVDEVGPVLVKIDVEGAEREVLSGAAAFTRRFRPLYIVETFSVRNLDGLLEAGYGAYALREEGNHLLVPCELEDRCRDVLALTAGRVCPV